MRWAAPPPGGTASEPPGTRTRFYYDQDANLRAVGDHLGHVTQQTYDGDDRPLDTIDARGNTVAHLKYTPFGGIEEVHEPDPVSGTSTLIRTRRNQYSERGQLRFALDALDHVTELRYDEDASLAGVLDPEGFLTEMVRNKRGWVEHEKIYVNEAGLGVLDTEFKHDKNGNVETVIDRRQKTYVNGHDARDRRTSLTYPSQKVHEWQFNAFGELRFTKDRDGKETTIEYDALGQTDVLKVKKGGTELVELKYEYENGVLLQHLTQKEGSSLVKLTLERDTLRRVEKQHVKVGLQPFTTTAQTYNEVDWAISRTPPKSPVQTFEYYANGLAARRTIGPARWTSTYDPGGRLKTLEALWRRSRAVAAIRGRFAGCPTGCSDGPTQRSGRRTPSWCLSDPRAIDARGSSASSGRTRSMRCMNGAQAASTRR